MPMWEVARLKGDELRVLFRNSAAKLGMHEAVVEKDFWVCLMLDYLFHRSEWKGRFTFKGGTSLSKCFGLIERFSEDIDLILDWRVLGYGLKEPWIERSNTKQDLFNKEANLRAGVFLSEQLLPALQRDFEGIDCPKESFFIREGDPQTICFAYPRAFADDGILQVIRLEIGALADWSPSAEIAISPYAGAVYPAIFEQKSTFVRTVSPERTFWEKATILHQEANRPENLRMPLRYSRH